MAGVPRENGSCNQLGCHTGTAVNDPGGSVSVTFPNGISYAPGVTQHLVVTIDDSKQRSGDSNSRHAWLLIPPKWPARSLPPTDSPI